MSFFSPTHMLIPQLADDLRPQLWLPREKQSVLPKALDRGMTLRFEILSENTELTVQNLWRDSLRRAGQMGQN